MKKINRNYNPTVIYILRLVIHVGVLGRLMGQP